MAGWQGHRASGFQRLAAGDFNLGFLLPVAAEFQSGNAGLKFAPHSLPGAWSGSPGALKPFSQTHQRHAAGQPDDYRPGNLIMPRLFFPIPNHP